MEMKNENLKTGATETINLSGQTQIILTHGGSSATPQKYRSQSQELSMNAPRCGITEPTEVGRAWPNQKASKILTLLRRKLVVTSHNDYKFSSHLTIIFSMHPACQAWLWDCLNDQMEEMVGCDIYPPCLILGIWNNLSTLFSCYCSK